MKRALLLIILFSVLFFPMNVHAEEMDGKITDSLIMEQLSIIDIGPLEEMIREINNNKTKGYIDINLKDMILSLVKGQANFNFTAILKGILDILFNEIMENSKMLAELIFISLVCAVLKNMADSFGDSGIGDVAFYACYLIIIGIVVKSFVLAVDIGKEAIENMVSFIQALIPVLLSLLIAVGSITTSAIFKPVIVATIGISTTIIKDIVIPLVFFTTILSIINNLSSKIHISKLASLLKQISLGIIGILLTIFLGVTTIQGVVASTADGVTIRTARFALDNFIPIVGGFMSEAVDTVLGCSLLIKNAIGVVGLVVILLLISFPVLKILSLIIVYKLTAALIEPISDIKIVNCLNDISGTLVILFATVMSVAIMFFIAITALVGAGNITAMIR